MTPAPGAVAAIGAHLPRLSIDAETIAAAWDGFEARGIGAKRVPAGDEDALTVAAAASERALDAGIVERADLATLAFATTTPPLAEEDLTARLGSMLGVPESASRQVHTGSTRAGTRALSLALEADELPALVVVADCPRGEPADARDHAAGAGGAAFLVIGTEGAGDRLTVRERATHTSAYPGTRFRQADAERVDGIDVRSYDREAFRETVSGAVERLDSDPQDVDAAAIQAPDGDLPYRAGSALGLDRETVAAGTVVNHVGDVGAASVLLGVARAVAEGCEQLLAVGYGSGGGADALRIEGTCPVSSNVALQSGEGAGEELTYPEYLRERDEITTGEPAGGGACVSVPAWRRSLPQRHRLVAGECPDCGALAFPPEGACPSCHELVEYERMELPRTGTVETATTIAAGTAPPEFAPAQSRSGDLQVVLVAFEHQGESVTVPLQATAEADTLAHGDRVRAVVRHLYTQEGVPRYARKVRPGE